MVILLKVSTMHKVGNRLMADKALILMLFTLMSTATPNSYAAPLSLPDNLGSQVYQRNCSVCHGQNAEGAENWKIQNGYGELPAPPHNKEGHTWRHSDNMLQRMIKQGWRDPFNKTKRLTMPAFENALNPKEIDAVIAYMKTFWTPVQVDYQKKENLRR